MIRFPNFYQNLFLDNSNIYYEITPVSLRKSQLYYTSDLWKKHFKTYCYKILWEIKLNCLIFCSICCENTVHKKMKKQLQTIILFIRFCGRLNYFAAFFVHQYPVKTQCIKKWKKLQNILFIRFCGRLNHFAAFLVHQYLVKTQMHKKMKTVRQRKSKPI